MHRQRETLIHRHPPIPFQCLATQHGNLLLNAHFVSDTRLVASGLGKLSGSGRVTLPVAAHSQPRFMTVMKPTQRIARVSLPPTWPMTVVNTRPLPYGIHQIIGSRSPVPPLSF